MSALNCPPSDQKVGVLSGGREKKGCFLVDCFLVNQMFYYLMSRLTTLDAETVWWLERHLQQYKGTVIAVTHDRYFLDNVAGWILELDRGQRNSF